MKVLLIVDPQLPVPPLKYGGTERMAFLLAKSLEKEGFTISLLAGKGSMKLNGFLWFHSAPGRSKLSRAFFKIWFQILSLIAAFQNDVVVNFGRVDYLWAILKLTNKPVVLRFGNPVRQKEIGFIESLRKNNVVLVFISQNQRNAVQSSCSSRVIHNALDLRNFLSPAGWRTPQRRYLAYVGILSRAKGIDVAIRIAQRTNHYLFIAGKIPDTPDELDFFNAAVRPILNKSQFIKYVGQISDEQKLQFYSEAKATLFPIQSPEAFGIVMIESLACGTPVIAFNRYSTSEVIRHGVTGYLCETEDEMSAAVGRLHLIDNEDCKVDARNRFDTSRYVIEYKTLLADLRIASRRL